MKRWEVEYEDGGHVHTFEFEHEETLTLEAGARELLRHLRDGGRTIPPIGQPHDIGEDAVRTLSVAGITVLEPRPVNN